MEPIPFNQQIRDLNQQQLYLCIGLDPDPERIPVELKGNPHEQVFDFNWGIIYATHEFAAAYKLNFGFYFKHGVTGMVALAATIGSIHQLAPGKPVIMDGKWGDTNHSSQRYAHAVFEEFGADAATVNPYVGQDGIQPFLEWRDRGVLVLCRTSNPGNSEFQAIFDLRSKTSIYHQVAQDVSRYWNTRENCGLLVETEASAELSLVRSVAGDSVTILTGIGAQGENLETNFLAGIGTSETAPLLLGVSDQILYASGGPDFATAAGQETRRLFEAILEITTRKRVGDEERVVG